MHNMSTEIAAIDYISFVKQNKITVQFKWRNNTACKGKKTSEMFFKVYACMFIKPYGVSSIL